MMNTSVYSFGAMLFAAILAGCNGNADNVDASGNFEADETIISAEGSGRIMELALEEGQTLKPGEVVGYIDTMQLHLKKKQLTYSMRAILSRRPDAESQLSTIRKQIETAKYERSRTEKLLKDDAATKKQLDDWTAQVDLLEKQYTSLQKSLAITTQSLESETLPLKAQVEQIDDQIARSVIINPVNGTVLSKYAEKSEMVVPGKSIYKIADISSLQLRAYISGDQLAVVKLGQKIKVLVDAPDGKATTHEGTVEWISDKAEFTPKTIQTKEERANLVYAMKVRVPNDGSLKIGMYADVSLK